MILGYCTQTTIKKLCRYVTNSNYKTIYYIEYMSIWSRLIGIKKTEDINNVTSNKITSVPFNATNYAIIDVEISLKDHKIHDIGALRHDGTT